jgi:gp16 family phage-associated protein
MWLAALGYFPSMQRPSKTTMTAQTASEDSSWTARLAQARTGFFDRGESVAEWARKHGFRANAVYQVLNGHAMPSRGNAHRIAVALGIKPVPDNSLGANAARHAKEPPML